MWFPSIPTHLCLISQNTPLTRNRFSIYPIDTLKLWVDGFIILWVMTNDSNTVGCNARW